MDERSFTAEEEGEAPSLLEASYSPPTSAAETAKTLHQAPVTSAEGGTVEAPETHSQRMDLAWAKLLWLLTFLGVLLAVCYLIPYMLEQSHYAMARGKQRAESEMAAKELAGSPLEQLSRASQLVSRRVGPSVVHLMAVGSSDLASPTASFPYGFRTPRDGQGSGFIVDGAGHVVTNSHVVEGAAEIQAVLSDGRKATAQVIGVDKATDLALLRIDAADLTPAEWGDSDELDTGSLVWAIGSPFGLQRSVTSGIISGKHRVGMSRSPYQDFLQTDAAVNPGNSGGPLVDTHGRVVGVNTAIVGEAYQGVSFAIPSRVARSIIERLQREGRIRRGWLGVELAELAEDDVKSLGLSSSSGARVVRVLRQQGLEVPALKAGMQAEDVVTHWNGEAVAGSDALRQKVADTPIGSTAKITLLRDGMELVLPVVVGERPVQF